MTISLLVITVCLYCSLKKYSSTESIFTQVYFYLFTFTYYKFLPLYRHVYLRSALLLLQDLEEFSFVTQLAGITDHLSVAMRLSVSTGEDEP